MNRRWIALPAAALLAVVGVPAASAEDGGLPSGPPDDAVLVAEVPGDMVVGTGVEVSDRVITWGSVSLGPDGDGDGPAVTYAMNGRAFTPDLGRSQLLLGGALDMALPESLWATSNDRWSIGVGPEVVGAYGEPLLLVKPAGGPVRTYPLAGDAEEFRSSVALWEDTALVGDMVVNLVTDEVTYLGDEPCIEGRGAVLADGVLIFNDVCDGGVAVADVSPGGFVPSDLDDARIVTSGLAEFADYSRGLLVLVRDGGDGQVLEWGRLGADFDSEQLEMPIPSLGVRAHGERFVFIAMVGESLVGIVVEADAPDEAVAVVPLSLPMFSAEVQAPEDPASLDAFAASPGSGGQMAMSIYVGIDIFGRTLAWFDDGAVYALTLPPLSGGAATVSAPAAVPAGDQVTVTGSGFVPWEEVAVWLNSDAELLGLGHADADGAVTLSVTVPEDAVGAHALVLHGVESGWDAQSALTVQGVNPGLEVQTG